MWVVVSEIGDLSTLTQLSLADNELETLPPEIGRLAQLTHLNLKNNALKSLPIEILSLQNLQMLQLSGNPLPIPDDILNKWDRPAEILDYYRQHLVPTDEGEEVDTAVDPTSLHWIICENFSEEALKNLCGDICVDYEGLGGRTQAERVRALIAYHEIHGLGDEFRRLVSIMRPEAFGR